MKSDKQILEQFYGNDDRSGHKSYAERELKSQKDEDEINRAFYDGDKAEYTAGFSNDAKEWTVVLNRVKPLISAYIGFAAQNRRVPEYFAMESTTSLTPLDQATDIANQMLRHCLSQGNAEQIETEVDKQHAICGYGVMATAIDYTDNVDGEVKYREVTEDYYWDPMARQKNLRDRRFEFLKTKMNVSDAITFFGGEPEDYEAASKPEYGKFKYKPLMGGTYDRIAYDWAGKNDPDLINIYEYNWFELEKYYRIGNPVFEEENQLVAPYLLEEMRKIKELRLMEEESDNYYEYDPAAQIIIADKEVYKDLRELFKRYEIADIDSEEYVRKVYYTAIISGTKVFKKRKSVIQNGFPCLVKTADYDRKNKLFTGMVSSLREPAKYANKMISEFMFIIAGTAKPGVFYDISMVHDVDEFEKNMNRNAKAIGVNGDPNRVIANKQLPVMPNGYDTLYPMFLESLNQVIGFSAEAMGMGELSQPSFELEQQRIKQVMVTLAPYFDSTTLFDQDLAKIHQYYLKRLAKNREGRIIVANDDLGRMKASEVYSNMLADSYSIDITEAPDSPTKRKEQAQIMMAYADKMVTIMPQKATEIFAFAAKYLPISSAEKGELREMLMPPQDPEQAALAQEKAAKEEAIREASITADISKKQAEAELKLAQTEKTKAETDKVDVENLIATTNPINDVNINL